MPRTSFSSFQAQASAEVKPRRAHRTDMSFRHDAIIDYMLLHPNKRMVDVAAHFNVTPAHLSILRHSDSFSRELDARRARIAQRVEETTVSRIRDLANCSLETMTTRIQKDVDIPIAEVRESCKMALDALGYSRGPSGAAEGNRPVAVQINIGKADLELARQRIKGRSITVEDEEEIVAAE